MGHCFIADGWGALLRRHDLDTFEALWRLPEQWVEPPNVRRGGWSGVTRMTLELSLIHI